MNSSSSSSVMKSVVEDSSIIGISGESQQSATTKFIDDANVVIRDTSMMAHIDDTIINLSDTQKTEQSVIDYLTKPIVVASGTFQTTDTLATISSFSMPYSGFQSTQGVVWRQKVAGYFGIRADMRFRLVVNGNPFQAGRYCMGWVPLAGAYGNTTKSANRNNMMIGTLVQRTTIPHIEIDINTQTAGELLVPFCSVYNFWSLNNILGSGDLNPLGFLNIYPYSPLISPTGSSSVSYTVYMSFENIKLFGAASAQAGFSDKEISNKNNGPISGIATSIAKGFNEFADIPLISGYARSISWISDRIAKTASMFGYSKPIQGDSLAKMEILNASTHSQVDGDSDARSLALISKPGVTIINGLSGKQYDEMDFSYIVRKYAYFSTLTWAETTPVGNLGLYTVQPTIQLVIGGATHFPPVSFIANQFQLWRGSLKYRFKFVKTKFHTGRLSFSFYPTDDYSYVSNPVYVNRLIVDIRDTTEVELVVPYISRSPYTNASMATGSIYVDVVDALVAPASVGASIQILVEVCGGDDLEFGIPAPFEYTPTQFTPQSFSFKTMKVQSGLVNDSKVISTTIGNSKVEGNSIIFSSACIGDKVSSFRALLKRFTPIQPNNKIVSSNVSYNGTSIWFPPDFIPIIDLTPPTNQLYTDHLGLVASCYAIWRGGIRIRDVLDLGLYGSANQYLLNTPTQVYLQTETFIGATAFPISGGGSGVRPYFNFPLVEQTVGTNNVITIEVPQYTKTFGRSISDLTTSQNAAVNGYSSAMLSSASGVVVTINLPVDAASGVTFISGYSVHNFYRAMADDGDLSCFICVPPLLPNVYGANSAAQYLW